MSAPAIIYEDGEALVIDKPAGLPIERPRAGGPSLEDHLDDLRLGFQRQPTPVHRIDTDTSGCLLLARNPKAHKRLARAFEDRLVAKTYLGLVAGPVEGEEGVIDLALSKISSAEKGWRMIAARKGKHARTYWQVVERRDRFTIVRFAPETGRTHQIRIHALAGLGHALLGDPVYGTKAGAPRTMLHALSLEVERAGKSQISAHAPLPSDFAALEIAPADRTG